MGKKKKGFLDGYKTYDTSEGFGNPNEWREAFKTRMGLDEAEKVLDGRDPLVILGITTPNPTWDAIKAAFRKMVFKCHPDRFPNDPEGAAKAAVEFKKLEAAMVKLEARFKK